MDLKLLFDRFAGFVCKQIRFGHYVHLRARPLRMATVDDALKPNNLQFCFSFCSTLGLYSLGIFSLCNSWNSTNLIICVLPSSTILLKKRENGNKRFENSRSLFSVLRFGIVWFSIICTLRCLWRNIKFKCITHLALSLSVSNWLRLVSSASENCNRFLLPIFCCFKCFSFALAYNAPYTTNITDSVYYKFSSFYSILVLRSSGSFPTPFGWNSGRQQSVCGST